MSTVKHLVIFSVLTYLLYSDFTYDRTELFLLHIFFRSAILANGYVKGIPEKYL